MTENAPYKAFGLRMVQAGYSPVPIGPDTKRPPLKDWSRFCRVLPTAGELMQLSAEIPGAGIGLACGAAVTLDFDDLRAIDLLLPIMPRTPVGKVGQKGFSLVYRQTAGFPQPSKRYTAKDDCQRLIEILASGTQTVLPPTIHPDTGQPYRWWTPWEGDSTPALWDVPLADLPELPPHFWTTIELHLVQAGLICDPRPVLGDPSTVITVNTDQMTQLYRLIPWADVRLREQCADLAVLTEGRFAGLHRVAVSMGNLVACGAIGEATVRAALQDACDANGFFKRKKGAGKEFGNELERGLSYGATLPLSLPERIFRDMPAPQMPVNMPAPVTPLSQGGPTPPQPHVVTIPAHLEGNSLPETRPELIKRLLPADAGLVAMVLGQSGAGKSFYTTALAVALAGGREFLDMPVRENVGVIYVAAEGAGTIDERLFAAKRQAGLEGRQIAVAIIPSCPDLMDEQAYQALAVTINQIAAQMVAMNLCKRVGAVIIDTVTVAFGMADENDNSEATKICLRMRALGEATGTVVIPVHHLGKNKDGGARGASAWRGASDTGVTILADREEATGEVKNRKLAITKARSGPEGPFCCFELEEVDLGQDRYGDQRTTCIFKRTEGDPAAKKESKTRSFFDDAFDAVAALPGERIAIFNGTKSAVDVEKVRLEFLNSYPADNEESAKRAWRRSFKDVTDKAKGNYRYGKNEGVSIVWREKNETFNDAFPMPPTLPPGVIAFNK